MLTARFLPTRVLAIGLTFFLLAAVSLASVSSAVAAECHWEGPKYVCNQPGDPGEPGEPGEPGDPGGGGGTGAPCPLQEQADTWRDNYRGTGAFVSTCTATMVCITGDLYVPLAPPEGEPPSPDSRMMILQCYPGGYGPPSTRAFWSDDDEPEPPTLAEQAQEAIGNIDLGTASASLSPDGRSLVSLDTWFWLEGGFRQEAVGTSAFGLRAIATFKEMRVSSGDGASFTCPFVTTAAQAESECSHTYTRSSVGGGATRDGRPAYAVEVTTLYTLRFEVNGNPVPQIPGAPATLAGPTADTAVVVDEAQALVNGTR